MSQTDPRIDAYLAKAAAFAQPLLGQLRTWVHEACPEAQETMKWSMPFFEYHGSILGHMAAFKAHCAFGFWRGGPGGEAARDEGKSKDAMGHFGRIESQAHLPGARDFKALVKAQMARIDSGEASAAQKAAAPKPAPKPALETPPDLVAALAKVPAARDTFGAFAPGQRREYVTWIVEAKREETRGRRIAQAVEWLAEGKARNWKYER